MGGIPVAIRHQSHPVPGRGWRWAGSRSRCDTTPAQCQGAAGDGRDPGREATPLPPSARAWLAMGGIPVAMRHLSRPVPGRGWWAGFWSRCDTYPAQCRGVAGGGRDSGRDATPIPPSAGALVGLGCPSLSPEWATIRVASTSTVIGSSAPSPATSAEACPQATLTDGGAGPARRLRQRSVRPDRLRGGSHQPPTLPGRSTRPRPR